MCRFRTCARAKDSYGRDGLKIKPNNVDRAGYVRARRDAETDPRDDTVIAHKVAAAHGAWGAVGLWLAYEATVAERGPQCPQQLLLLLFSRTLLRRRCSRTLLLVTRALVGEAILVRLHGHRRLRELHLPRLGLGLGLGPGLGLGLGLRLGLALGLGSGLAAPALACGACPPSVAGRWAWSLPCAPSLPSGRRSPGPAGRGHRRR